MKYKNRSTASLTSVKDGSVQVSLREINFKMKTITLQKYDLYLLLMASEIDD